MVMVLVLVSLQRPWSFSETFQCFHSTVFAAASFIGLCHLYYQISGPRLTVEIEFYFSVSKISYVSVNIVNEANDGHFLQKRAIIINNNKNDHD